MNLSFLKDHPFPVEAFFDSSLVLTYAVPVKELQHMLPPCLEPDTFNNEWAFIAAAIVKTKYLRPKGFPEWMGNDFILTGYRIFVRYTTSEGKRLRGLYILRSETDKKKMEWLGNIFTHYSYRTTDIQLTSDNNNITVSSSGSRIAIEATFPEDIPLPATSPFKEWKEARRFAGPLPFTFTFDPKSKEVLIIEGVREHWTPTPVHILKDNIGFIEDLQLRDIRLANAFIIRNIPYHWKKGRKDIWQG